jgi:hypothetical protein
MIVSFRYESAAKNSAMRSIDDNIRDPAISKLNGSRIEYKKLGWFSTYAIPGLY